MGRKKNSAKARAKNLPKLAPKPTALSIEETSDSENDGNFEPEATSDSDLDTETDEDDEFFGKIQTELDLLSFSSALQTAHDDAVARERQKHRKRKSCYTGNSKRNLRRYRQIGRQMESKGFQSVANFFKPGRRDGEQVSNAALAPVSFHLLTLTPIQLTQFPQINLNANVNFENDPEELLDGESDRDDNSTVVEATAPEILLGREELDIEQQADREFSAASQSRIDEDLLPEGLLPTAVETSQEQPTSDAENATPSAQDSEERTLPQQSRTDNLTELDKMADHRDRPALRRAGARISVKLKDKKLTIVMRTRLMGMRALINFFLDLELNFGWIESSIHAAKAVGKGPYHARTLRRWTILYMRYSVLPVCNVRGALSLMDDEDFSQQIHLHLLQVGKSRPNGDVCAQDVADFMKTPAMKTHLGIKSGISLRTAQRWMNRMGWRYGQPKKGMYKDGHEEPEVVSYREKFCKRWTEYSKRMATFDNDGNRIADPAGIDLANGIYPLIHITHDESTFHANDQRRMRWNNPDAIAPQPKGEGQSIMVSDFLTREWGRLEFDGEEARTTFKAGKNRDGYFTNDDLVEQVDKAINIFEARTHGFIKGLFTFDNATTHRKRPPDGLSALKMPKGPSQTWAHVKGGPRMRNGTMLNGERQSFYFPDNHDTMPGWFKGMEEILKDRKLWRTGLLSECKGFKCPAGSTDCCCRRILLCQPDFASQKSHLEELIESRGHICDFYPKFHCELNFIEQYWGAAKYRYRASPRTSSIGEMEKNMLESLDAVPLLQIRRFANRSGRFIDAYRKGLDGAQAAWAARKYHGHRTLPGDIIRELKEANLA